MGDRAKDGESLDLAVKDLDNVMAKDEGDGWLSVDVKGHGVKFLPTSVDGDKVMLPAKILKCISAAFYRAEKKLESRVEDADGKELFCKVGDVVVAVDAGDGWLAVDRKFLPTTFNGEGLFETTK